MRRKSMDLCDKFGKTDKQTLKNEQEFKINFLKASHQNPKKPEIKFFRKIHRRRQAKRENYVFLSAI